jgi:FtsP/CotA-like multicopper oxidase with cupredoxin domain
LILAQVLGGVVQVPYQCHILDHEDAGMTATITVS